MSAHLGYDTDKRIIYVTTTPTVGELTLNVKVDIYSDMKEDWQSDSDLGKLKFPLSEPVGGNVTKPPTTISPYYFLKYGWIMRPYEADHTLYLENGYLLVDGGGNPWIKTLGGYTVNIRDTVPADAYSVPGEGGSITEQDKLDIAEKVWIALNRTLTAGVKDSEIDLILSYSEDILKLTGYKVTKSGDVITIYEANGVDIWRQYNLANDGRVLV